METGVWHQHHPHRLPLHGKTHGRQVLPAVLPQDRRRRQTRLHRGVGRRQHHRDVQDHHPGKNAQELGLGVRGLHHLQVASLLQKGGLPHRNLLHHLGLEGHIHIRSLPGSVVRQRGLLHRPELLPRKNGQVLLDQCALRLLNRLPLVQAFPRPGHRLQNLHSRLKLQEGAPCSDPSRKLANQVRRLQ